MTKMYMKMTTEAICSSKLESNFVPMDYLVSGSSVVVFRESVYILLLSFAFG